MARFQVKQSRNGGDFVPTGPVTRRFNGAQAILDDFVQNTVDNFRKHAYPGDRVVQGPATDDPDGPVAVVLVAPDFTTTVIVRIDRLS